MFLKYIFFYPRVPIDLSPLINLKVIELSSESDLDNTIEGIKKLNKVQIIMLQYVPLTPRQLTEYGIIYDTSPHYERDDILKDYIYDDEDYDIEPIHIDRLGKGGSGLPS